ncbi:MAG: hypothetical protein ABH986_01220 [archaeon]
MKLIRLTLPFLSSSGNKFPDAHETFGFMLFQKKESASCNLIPQGIKCTLKPKSFSSAQRKKMLAQKEKGVA